MGLDLSPGAFRDFREILTSDPKLRETFGVNAENERFSPPQRDGSVFLQPSYRHPPRNKAGLKYRVMRLDRVS